MDVRQAPTQYGAGNAEEPEKSLGSQEFDQPPQRGQHLELRGETWLVTEVHGEWLYVTPVGDV